MSLFSGLGDIGVDGSFGGKGGTGNKTSTSTSTSTYETTNTDKRLVVGEYGSGVSAENSTVSIQQQTLDPEIVNRALDAVVGQSAITGNALNDLLTGAKDIFGQSLQEVGSAYSKSMNDGKGSLEQKTIVIIVLAVAALGAVWAFRKAA